MSINSGYQQPQGASEAIDLAEELLVDRYYQPIDLQPLLTGLGETQQNRLRQLVTEIRSMPLADEALVKFYGGKIWEIYNNK